MDEMVIFAIRLQEQAGIDVISDGEWRRRHYVGEFLARVGGFARVRKFQHQGETKLTDVVVGKMSAPEPVFRSDAEFLVRHTDRCTKFALPSPFLIAIRYWHPDYSMDAYPTLESFMGHLTDILAAEARALSEAGIDVIQLDDPALTYFCDRRLTSGAQDVHDERLRRLVGDVDERDARALTCEGFHERRADAGTSAGDQDAPVAQARIDRGVFFRRARQGFSLQCRRSSSECRTRRPRILARAAHSSIAACRRTARDSRLPPSAG